MKNSVRGVQFVRCLDGVRREKYRSRNSTGRCSARSTTEQLDKMQTCSGGKLSTGEGLKVLGGAR
jgi:hypothetical protein